MNSRPPAADSGKQPGCGAVGMNPLNTLKIAWSSTDEQGLEYFHQLKKSGKPVIAIDPIRSETIEFFGDNATWIAPNMGTDVALMLGSRIP